MRLTLSIAALIAACGLCLSACGGGGGGEDEGGYGNTTQPVYDAQRFTLVDADGDVNDVVHDNQTGLTWTRTAWFSKFIEEWYTADGITLSQVTDLLGAMNQVGVGGYTNWRMPTIAELRVLWEGGVTQSDSVFKYVFTEESYWSSDDGRSCLPPTLGSMCYDYQVCLLFLTGTAVRAVKKTYFLWPVRG